MYSYYLCIRICLTLQRHNNRQLIYTAWKVSKRGVISSQHFPVFGLNTEIYGLNLCIQSEYRKIWTRNNSVFGHFSRSVRCSTGPQNLFLPQEIMHLIFVALSVKRRWCYVSLTKSFQRMKGTSQTKIFFTFNQVLIRNFSNFLSTLWT